MTLRRHGSKVFKIYVLVERVCLVSFIILPILIAWFMRRHALVEQAESMIEQVATSVVDRIHHKFGHGRSHKPL